MIRHSPPDRQLAYSSIRRIANRKDDMAPAMVPFAWRRLQRYNCNMDSILERSATTPSITFWGAARSITGSMHLIEAEGRRILLDCGLTQGRRDEARQRNSQFPFHPNRIDAVVLSHAHIDHCGNLPTLIRQGFRGQVYCTPATQDLVRVMLEDSARIQEEEAAHGNILRQYLEPSRQPLYTRDDADSAFDRISTISYGHECEILPGLRLTLHDAGHILGSAMIHLSLASGGSLTFTGDLGRRGMPVLPPADPIPPANIIVCESTYGGHVHESIEQTASRLVDVVKRTAERGGKVFIPAFSLGRTQLVIHFLCRAIRSGEIPRLPLYVDSPLAADIAEVYRRHPEALSEAEVQHLAEDPDFLGGPLVHYVRSFEESMRIAERQGPHVVVAASGMCEAGRIVHHLKHHIDDPRCSVVLVSYQASGTPGRRMLERGPTVRFLGREWNKWAEIVHLDGFSGHADQEDFLAYLTPLAGKVDRVCLVHGDDERAGALAEALCHAGFDDVILPEVGQRVPLRQDLSAIGE
jgi:metallo-beta-lactamase family protein